MKRLVWPLLAISLAAVIFCVMQRYPHYLEDEHFQHTDAFTSKLKHVRHTTRALDASVQQHSFLLIGGTGFVGTYLAEDLLARGAKSVSVLSRKRPNVGKILDGVEYIQGSITDAETMLKATKGVSIVFHLVAYYGNPILGHVGGHDSAERKRSQAINVGGMKNTVAACKSNGVKLLIYTSSTDVTFTTEGGYNVSEADKQYSTTIGVRDRVGVGIRVRIGVGVGLVLHVHD